MGDHSSDKKHRRSHSSRDKHQQRSSRGQVPVSRPYAPPSKDRAVAGKQGQAWPPPGYKPSRRRSMRLWTVGSALKTLAFGLLAVACMGGGWYVMRTMVGTGNKPTDTGAEVAQGKSELPDSKGKGEAPKPVDSKPPEIKPPEIKPPEIKPPDIKPPAPEIKPPAPETSVKPPEPKPEPKPPEPKPPEPKPATPDPTVPVVFLDKDIMPIFTIKCNRCHGDGQIKGKLDMRTLAAMLKGGASGPALVPGDLKKSSIFVEIDGKEPSMPPKGEPKLTDEEKKKIEDWIKGGAREKAGAAVAGDPKPAPAGGAVLAFEKDVLPILEKSCKECHGAVGGKADLNITTLAFLKRGGTGGPAVVPLSLEKSILWEKISTNQMPPEGKGEPLTKIEKDTIMKWITMGAKDNKEAMVK